MMESKAPLWPLFLYGLVVLSLAGIIIGLSYFLGQRHKERATDEPYEGGILSHGSARIRFSSQFYLIAMLFVIFKFNILNLLYINKKKKNNIKIIKYKIKKKKKNNIKYKLYL